MNTQIRPFDRLAPLFEDPEIMEVMIDGPERVSIEKNGKIKDTDIRFSSNDEIRSLIEDVLKMAGQEMDEGKTVYEVRLPDNSRMVAVLSPIALNGHSVIFRKWMKHQLTWDELFGFNAVTPDIRDLFQSAIDANVGILVAGGTSSGKTTITNRVVELIPPQKRIITVEKSHFYQFEHPRAVYLEANPAADMSFNDLLTTGAHMRPDWLVVGELEGPEALRALQLFSNGHSGITCMHATGVENALARLESMCLMANSGLGLEDIRQLIASALRLVAHQERLPTGRRKIVQVAELCGLDEGRYILQPLMRYDTEKETFISTDINPSWQG